MQQIDIQLRPKEAMIRLGCSSATFWRLVKTDPVFPPLTRYGKRCTSISAKALDLYLLGKTGGQS